MIQVSVQTVTPEMAQAWLEANVRNRHLRSEQVNLLIEVLRHDEWVITPDAIAFDVNGRLLNGQHRLHAITATGMPAESIIACNLPVQSYVVTDDGLKRTFGDVLESKGVANYNSVAATVACVLVWDRAGAPYTGGAVSRLRKVEKETYYDSDPEGFHAATLAGARIASRLPLSKSWWAGCMYYFTQADPEDAAAFEHMLRDGETPGGRPLESDHPVRVLRETLFRDLKQPRPTIRTNRVYGCALIVKAWNAYRRGQKVQLIKFRVGGANPETFPEVI